MDIYKMPILTEKVLELKHLAILCKQKVFKEEVAPRVEISNSFWNLIYVESGVINIYLNDDKHLIAKSNTVVFIPPEKTFSISSANDGDSICILASFHIETNDLTGFKTHPVKCNSKELDRLNCALTNFTQAAHLLKKLSEELPKASITEQNFWMYKTCLQVAYCSFEFLLLNFYTSRALHTKNSHKLIHHENIASSIEVYLAEHLLDSISLEETALHFGYSVSNLQKIFKAVTGESIIVYFNKLKLEEAKRLISQTSMNFAQIANYLGYTSSNYFSRIFKATLGMTPTEYANIYQNKKNTEESKKQDS